MARLPKNDYHGFRVLRNYFVHNGEMPSLRTIAAEMGYKSPRSVQLMLERLQRQKLIYYANGKIGLVHQPITSVGEHTVDVPVVGNVTCGALTLADQVVEDSVKVSTKIARPGSKHFILRVVGDSMNLSGINDGDLVLIRQQATAKENDVVVALVDDEATIKHFHREKDVIILKPNSTNSAHRPIILSEQLVIQGVVVQTIPNPF